MFRQRLSHGNSIPVDANSFANPFQRRIDTLSMFQEHYAYATNPPKSLRITIYRLRPRVSLQQRGHDSVHQRASKQLRMLFGPQLHYDAYTLDFQGYYSLPTVLQHMVLQPLGGAGILTSTGDLGCLPDGQGR